MKASEVLKKAKKVIVEKGWTRGELARNKYRHRVDPTSPSAVKFCAYGAIHNVLGIKDTSGGDYKQIDQVAEFLRLSIPVRGQFGWQPTVDDFNDDNKTNIDDVTALFNRAIKLAKENEKLSI